MTDTETKLEAALTLMRRLPPQNVGEHLENLIELLPEEEDELLQRIDQPLQVATDSKVNRKYLLCDYNRDGDSFRSPWSNEYFPAISEDEAEEVYKPNESLRELEVLFNDIFDAYRELYYPKATSTSSVYLWEQENGFAGCFLIKQDILKGAEGNRSVKQGNWDAIHVVDVSNTNVQLGKRKVTLTSTLLTHMVVENEKYGQADFGGNLVRQASKDITAKDNDALIESVGKMIEAMENTLRGLLQDLYFAKTNEVLNYTRSLQNQPTQTTAFTSDLRDSVAREGAKRTLDSET